MNIRAMLQEKDINYDRKVGNVYLSSDARLAQSQLYHFSNIEPYELLAAFSLLFRKYMWTTATYKELLKGCFSIMAADKPSGEYTVAVKKKNSTMKIWLEVNPDYKTIDCWFIIASGTVMEHLAPHIENLGETE